jgi:tRNA A-37 threonylcarbamoyl transferase component Bud32
MDMEWMEVNQHRYRVLRLLGRGKGGYSYLVSDGAQEYVLKQLHHEPCDYYTFGDKLASELRDYRRLKEIGIPMPELLDVDTKKERILKTYIRGDTIDRMVLRDEMLPEYLEQIRAMCEKLYAARLNIDYYPTNFVVQDGMLYYIDYECNEYSDQWNFENWGCQYWSKTESFLKNFQ